jgi:hypothetical protein
MGTVLPDGLRVDAFIVPEGGEVAEDRYVWLEFLPSAQNRRVDTRLTSADPVK